jgi:signal transduction histidine kinase
MFSTALLIFVIVVTTFICVITLLNNYRNKTNITFALIGLAMSFWQIANFLADKQTSIVLYWNRATFIGPLLTVLFFLLFVRYLVNKHNSIRYIISWGVPTLFVCLLCITPLVIPSVSPRMTAAGVVEGYNVSRGVGYPLVIAWLLILIISTVYNLIRGYKHGSLNSRTKLQYVLLAFSIATVAGVLTNVVLPLLMRSTEFSKLAPISNLLLVSLIGVAILKHRLFDIRLVVARTLAYTLSFGVLISIYLLVVLGLGQVVSIGPDLNSMQRYFYAGSALLFALTLPLLKKVFDRLTNALFYRDAYETQAVLDKVSGVIVGNIDPRKVQKGALIALSDALKSTFMTFLFIGSDGSLRQGDIVEQHWRIQHNNELTTALKAAGNEMILYDELEERGDMLHEVLRAEGISVIAPLVTKDEHIGYLVLGPKKSGNIYNSQDVGLLNIASNELAVALQNAQRFEEIQAFNITLQEKVTEATHELKRTNRKLVALDEAKDEFISMASHQLRTPLTSIKGYISMMMEGDLGKLTAQQEKALKEAFGSSQRMVFLIADFLNVSRIKTGKFVIEPKEVDLPQVVREEITQLREMAASRDITLQYQAPEVFPKVMLDDNKIRQVMMNIVDNAIYYTPAGGTVTIQLFVDSADVVFKVIDTGIGVPKREQHKLFTKFFRAGNARKARPDGTGLGLFMAQKIIAEQGGSIIFESTEGKGSTFGFRFPLSKIKT